MSLTEHCRDIITGSLLGDACLERNGKYVRLRVDHGARQQALVEWKHQQFAELQPSLPRRVEVYDVRTNKTYIHYRFVSRSLPILDEMYEAFYDAQGSKRIPHRIESYCLSALSIAVWYMDDGGKRSDCASGYLNTQGYTVEEVNTLRRCLADNVKLDTRLHFAAGRPRIYIAAAHFVRFCDLIRPHVIESMQYKLL